MKIKTTARQLKNGYGLNYQYQTGYCNLQEILRGLEPFAYTCGIYGWNFDAYNLDGILITTGYRGMFGKDIPHELTRKYEELAKKINERPFTDNNKEKDLKELRKQFRKELKEIK